MAITTLAGSETGMLPAIMVDKAASPTTIVGRWHSTFYVAGFPPAAVAPTPGLAGAALTSYAGQIPFTNPTSGNTYLALFNGVASRGASFLLVDRLWHNSGITITSTSAQTINSVAWPARDATGSTNGEGVYIAAEVSTATGSGTPTLTLGYTNSAGTASRTATNIRATSASSPIGVFYVFGLQAGDTGVRSIQTYTQSATWTSGTIHLVAFRIIAHLTMDGWNDQTGLMDSVTGGFPRLYDDTVPWIVSVPSGTTGATAHAAIAYTQG